MACIFGNSRVDDHALIDYPVAADSIHGVAAVDGILVAVGEFDGQPELG